MPFAKTAPQRVQPMARQSLETPSDLRSLALSQTKDLCEAGLSPQDTGSHKLRHGVLYRGSGRRHRNHRRLLQETMFANPPGRHHRINGGVSLSRNLWVATGQVGTGRGALLCTTRQEIALSLRGHRSSQQSGKVLCILTL